MGDLSTLVGAIVDKWNYEIRYMDGDVEKVYRCASTTAMDAIGSAVSSRGGSEIPDAFIVMTREFSERNENE